MDMAWTEGAKTPDEGYAPARIFGWRLTGIHYERAERDLLRSLGKALIGVGALLGVGAGVVLGRTRVYEGKWASNALLSYPLSLSWNLLSSWLSIYVIIGLGIVLTLSIYLLPAQTRQNLFSLFGLMFFGLITCSVVGTATYFVTIFYLELKSYFGA